MVIAGDDYLTNDAIMFWGSQSPGDISDDLKAWLNIRVPEVQVLWRTVGTMDRRRGMWLELREQLECRDPTNAWTRQYDDLYIEAQIIALCKTVFSKRRKGRRCAALSILLNEFRQRPQFAASYRRLAGERRSSRCSGPRCRQGATGQTSAAHIAVAGSRRCPYRGRPECTTPRMDCDRHRCQWSLSHFQAVCPETHWRELPD
jgi:hypothetical protein